MSYTIEISQDKIWMWDQISQVWVFVHIIYTSINCKCIIIFLVHVYVTICSCKYMWIRMYMPWGAPCPPTQFHWDVELLGWSEIGERMVGWSWSWPHPVQKAEWDRTSSTWVYRSPYLYMMVVHREIQWWVVTPMVSAWHYVHDLTHPKQSCTVSNPLLPNTVITLSN